MDHLEDDSHFTQEMPRKKPFLDGRDRRNLKDAAIGGFGNAFGAAMGTAFGAFIIGALAIATQAMFAPAVATPPNLDPAHYDWKRK